MPTSPLTPRHEAAGAFFDGRFYVVGGRSDPPCPPNASCAAAADPPRRDGASYDPVAGAWQRIAPAPTPVGGVVRMTVVDDRIYLLTPAVGRGDSPVSFLSYAPRTDTWTTLPLPPAENLQLVAAGRRLIALAGSDEHGPAVDFVFDPRVHRWERLPDDPLGPSFDRGAVWLGDRLLLTGSDLVDDPGAGRPSLTRLAVLDNTLERWTLLPDSDIIGGSPVWVAARVVFPGTGSADGGQIGNWGRDYFYGAIFDPVAAAWTPLPQPPDRRSGLEGIVGSVGDRTLVGGHLLEPQTLEWTRLPEAPWGTAYRAGQTIVTSPSGVFVWGGGDAKDNLSDGYFLAA